MVEIVVGDGEFIHLPDDHLIKTFCKEHNITSYKTQKDLMKLINACVKIAIEGMIKERLSDLQEVVASNKEVKVEEKDTK